ncbi:hypothetical protein [Nonomuraea sp. NPDC023979]|uniref:hypothetical protein n=1 Tax=Nonomuraea sp. NPDC023979 TaxID=3154796 RepID=UPI0033D8D370
MALRLNLAFIAALAVAGSMGVAGPAAATATPGADEFGPLTATGCTARNGPGDFNDTCVYVYGQGTHVERVRGAMVSWNFPPVPLTLCGVKVHVWGTYANGARFDRTGQAQCSYGGSAYVNWYPNAHFKDRTSICVRTQFKDQWSNPACIQIRK